MGGIVVVRSGLVEWRSEGCESKCKVNEREKGEGRLSGVV